MILDQNIYDSFNFSASLPTSCSAQKEYQPGLIGPNRAKYPLDPDDSGPLPPVQVTCDYSKNTEGLTEIETKGTSDGVTIEPTTDYAERFSYKKEIEYEVINW